MAHVIAFNLTVTLAWWTGILFTALSFFCIGAMFCLRGRGELLKNRSKAFNEKWQETLYQLTFAPEKELRVKGQEAHKLTAEEKKNLLFTLHEKGRFDPVEALPDRDLPHFLFLWNYLHETLRGESKENLNSLAQLLDVNRNAFKMLKSISLEKQILAINTLGNLHEMEAYEKIEKLIFGRDPIISLWAWRALFRIDFEETLEKHLSMIAIREDWSPTFVVKVLLELDKDLISEPLAKLVEENFQKQTNERQMARLISYLTIAHVSSYAPLIHKILHESEQPEVLIACLRLVNSDESLPRVRELIKSERWEVRLQVVQTLGRLGHRKDTKLLINSLNDLDWWVRYRSASALMTMPLMTEKKIKKLAKTLPNEFARDILHQVLAENRLLCYTQPSSSILSK